MYYELKTAGKAWNTITQLVLNKKTLREFEDVLCSMDCGLWTMGLSKHELKLANICPNINIDLYAVTKLEMSFYVQGIKVLFSSDKFSPVFSDSNPVLGQTLQLLFTI